MTALRYKGYALSRNEAGMWEAQGYRVRLGPYGNVDVLRAAIDQHRGGIDSPRLAITSPKIVVEPKDFDGLRPYQRDAIEALRYGATIDLTGRRHGKSFLPGTVAQLFQDGQPVHTQEAYSLRDHEAAVWRNRPDADEDLYDAPVVEPYPPRVNVVIWIVALLLGWAILGGVALLLSNLFAWAFGFPPMLAAGASALTIAGGFVTVAWVRR